MALLSRLVIFAVITALGIICLVILLPADYLLWSIIIAPVLGWFLTPKRSQRQSEITNKKTRIEPTFTKKSNNTADQYQEKDDILLKDFDDTEIIPDKHPNSSGFVNLFSNFFYICIIAGAAWLVYNWYQSPKTNAETINSEQAGLKEGAEVTAENLPKTSSTETLQPSKKRELKIVKTGHNAGLYSGVCMPSETLLLRIPMDTELKVEKEVFVFGGGMIGFPMYYVNYNGVAGWMSSQSVYDAPDFIIDKSKHGKCQIID